jgi:hypothetical protein
LAALFERRRYHMVTDQPLLIFAGLLGTWFGAAVFYVVVIGPAAVRAGPSGVGFLQMLARRYGTGPFYAVLAFLTVIAGIWMYLANGVHQSGSADNVWVSVAVGLAILALLLGASANRMAERKWVNVVRNVRGSATEEQGIDVTTALAKAEKTNVMTTLVLGLALICVVLSRTMT